MEQPQQGGRTRGHTQHSCRPSPTPPSRRADLQAPQPQLQPMGDSWPPPLGMTKDQERIGQISSMHPTPHWRHVAEPRSYGLTQSWLHALGTHTSPRPSTVEALTEHPLHSRCCSRQSPWAAPPPFGPGLLPGGAPKSASVRRVKGCPRPMGGGANQGGL